ncbi:hypothetical protein LDK61_09120, partial [Melissococcus plutonius]
AKTSEAQKRATKNYRAKNRERTTMQSMRSSAKTFIKKYAGIEDLEEFEMLIKDRKKELQE